MNTSKLLLIRQYECYRFLDALKQGNELSSVRAIRLAAADLSLCL
jgi:hypothetical protein